MLFIEMVLGPVSAFLVCIGITFFSKQISKRVPVLSVLLFGRCIPSNYIENRN